MRSVEVRSGRMFADVPRPWGLAGALTIAVWILLAIAFVTDAVPSASSEEWLYQLEAQRAEWAHRLSANQVRASAQVAARRAPGVARGSAVAARATADDCRCN